MRYEPNPTLRSATRSNPRPARRNTSDAELRDLERAALASPGDHDLAERLVHARARHGTATVADVVLAVSRRLAGKAPVVPSLVRRVSDILWRRVSPQEVWRAIDELYERDLVDARGAFVDPARSDCVLRLLFSHGGWDVTTQRDHRRERSGLISGPTRGTDWLVYENGRFGFDRPEIIPVRVREILARVVDRKLETPDTESRLFMYPVCEGCTRMRATDMIVRHPDWYVCPNVAVVQAIDASVMELVDTLRTFEWSPFKIFAEGTDDHIGWGTREPGVLESGLVWYRGVDRDPEADRRLRRRWLLKMLQRSQDTSVARVASTSPWQRKLDESWRAILAREAVELVMADVLGEGL